MKIHKTLASIILATIILNIVAGNIYEIKATNIQNEETTTKQIENSTTENNTENETIIETTNTSAENNLNNEILNNLDGNITNNEENNIKNEINNETINSTNKNEINEEIDFGTNNIIENEVNNGEIEEANKDEKNIDTENITENYELENEQENNIMLLSEETEQLGVTYRTHVQDIGWQGYVQDEKIAGTSGKSLRLEGINIKLTGNKSNIKIKYQVHVQNIGWQNWKTDGEMAGTQGLSYRLEGIKIKLESSDDYSVMYRVHVQDIGWQGWKIDGEMAGTEGKSLRLEAIQIKIVPKTKKGKVTIQTPTNGQTYYNPQTIKVVGWKMANVSNTTIKTYIDNSSTPIDSKFITYKKRDDIISSVTGYGTVIENPNPGFEISVESSKLTDGEHIIKVVLYTKNNEVLEQTTIKVNIDRKLHVQYRAHVENIGWQGYVKDGNMSGTSGKSYRVEAMNISLINAPSNAKILYRTHVQNVGWQGWKSNGEMTGTSGRSLRIEAIEIKLENMSEYTVEYKVHIQDKGWTDWFIDGETAGTVGQSKRIEAIKIRIVPHYKRSYKGIDVSQFNGNINWGFVKRDNVDFAFIRVGYRGYGQAGNFAEDTMFKKNIEAAKTAGIPVGVYFVTQAITDTEAIEEANWVLEKIKKYNIQYPIAIDIEEAAVATGDIPRTQNLDTKTRTRLVKLFCQTIKNAGYTPMVYTNVDWAANKLTMSELSKYDTWIAHYKYNSTSKPNYSGTYTIWQYSDKGSINGILGNVDLNISYKKYY